MTGNSVSFAHPAIAQAKLVLVGPPGALFHRIIDSVRSLQESEPFSLDEMVSQEIAKGTAAGVALARSLADEQVAADDQVLTLMRRWFWGRKIGKGFILTGFPFNRAQAVVFDDWLDCRDESISICIEVRQSEEDSLREAQTCYECPAEGRRFYKHPEGFEWSECCDSCGSGLVPVPERARAEIRSWYALRRKSSESVVGYYRERALLQSIQADLYPFSSDFGVSEILESVFAFA